MRTILSATAAVLVLALAAAAPAHAAPKKCGQVGGLVNEVYDVTVTPSSITCSSAKSVLNAFRTKQEKLAQSGKRLPSSGVIVKTYRCRATGSVAGGYVTQRWICTKGSRKILGYSKSLYTD